MILKASAETWLTASQAFIADFHSKHFSAEARNHFSLHFLGGVEDGVDPEYVEEDELGYYPDGIKRTLTDEQIAIFRHSEFESLRREQRYAQESIDTQDESATPSATSILDVEEGELADKSASIASTEHRCPNARAQGRNFKKNAGKMNKKQRKAEYAKEKGFFKQKIKPDLRKRTWDKVDAGMDSLMYDEDGSSAASPGMASQRRRISYNDD